MYERQDEWCFLRARAAQLFEEGHVKAALRLMQQINREQLLKLKDAADKCERIENC